MWVVYAFASAVFAGITAILAKVGLQKIDSTVATALRTIVVLVFAWLMVLVVGSGAQIGQIAGTTWVFLVLSGLATGASWLCYFKALQIGDVNKVTPVDKSSLLLTMILAFLFLGEGITLLKVGAMVLIGVGTYMMIGLKKSKKIKRPLDQSWLFYALGSAFFAAIVAILGKVGMEGVESNLGTAIRTVVVLVMAWLMVFVSKKQTEVKTIDRKSGWFLVFSGLATGASWLFYFRALQEGPASVVVPIDKLSIVLTVAFSYLFLKENLTTKSAIGLGLIVAGTLLMLVK